MRRVIVVLLVIVCAGLGLVTPAAAADTVWLCRPGLPSNPCTTPRTATRIAADGTKTVEPAAKPGPRDIDCFYVYPTVSLQPTVNANLDIEPNETGVALAQASRYSQVCKVYAPMYRQLTIAAIG